MTEPQAKIEADALTRECVQRIEHSEIHVISAAGYVNSVLAQQGVQAILVLLQHKGIISETEVNKALADAYHAQLHRMKGTGEIILAPAAMMKPNGSY